jgi:hypothetical protein
MPKTKRRYTKKQHGGLCCKYTNTNRGCVSDNRQNPIGRADDYAVENDILDANTVNIRPDQSLQILWTRHAYTHMQDVGIDCYDKDAFVTWLQSNVPNMHIARGATI